MTIPPTDRAVLDGEPVSPFPPLGSDLRYHDLGSGELAPVEVPTVLDLFYTGRVNSVFAPPGEGKTNLARGAVAETAAHGGVSIILDAEDVATAWEASLDALGMDAATRSDRVEYLNVGGPISDADIAFVGGLAAAFGRVLVVMDSLPELLTATGLDETSSTEVTSWFRRVARPIAHVGACVLLLDHPVKSGQGNGYSRGSGAKLAACDGAVIELEQLEPFTPAQSGSSNLIVRKDRLGGLRAGKGASAGIVRYEVADSRLFNVRAIRTTPMAHGETPPVPTALHRPADAGSF